MQTLYLICAVAGGTILVIQTLLLVLGLGGGDEVHGAGDLHDGDLHDGSDGVLKFLSIKALVAFVTFFGLMGLAGAQNEWQPATTLLAALGAGAAAMVAIGYLMAGLTKLQSTGNIDLRNAVGVEGEVYLRVPAAGQGQGKVLLDVQGRRVECKAISKDVEIPTGSRVTVIAAPTANTVQVQVLT